MTFYKFIMFNFQIIETFYKLLCIILIKVLQKNILKYFDNFSIKIQILNKHWKK